MRCASLLCCPSPFSHSRREKKRKIRKKGEQHFTFVFLLLPPSRRFHFPITNREPSCRVHRTNQRSAATATAGAPIPARPAPTNPASALRLAALPPMDLPPLSHQALFASVRSADADAVRRLLAGAEASALAAAQTDARESALYVAAEAVALEVVRLLLPLYDLEAATLRSRLDLDAFHVAAKQGHTGYHRIVKALIERDPEIVAIRDRKGQTALHMAVKGKNTDVVEELLMADVSILNVRDKKANTALHIATRKWRPQMVQLLLAYESLEVNAINSQSKQLWTWLKVPMAYISKLTGFRVFCLLNAIALFISLAVVVVQITLVAWETGAQKQIIKIVNKLMWSACLSTSWRLCRWPTSWWARTPWMAFTISVVGGRS
ncbi:hypothetical protein ZWY2020_005799 [Hordeum vulgare]|nr:hypothetical protein ZWY2020_005799 [Hordeum vulgare]